MLPPMAPMAKAPPASSNIRHGLANRTTRIRHACGIPRIAGVVYRHRLWLGGDFYFSKTPAIHGQASSESALSYADIHSDVTGTVNTAQQLKAAIEALRKQQAEKRPSEEVGSLYGKQPRIDDAALLALIDEIDALEEPVQPAITQPVHHVEPEVVASDIPSEFFFGSDDESDTAIAPIPAVVTRPNPSVVPAAPGKGGAALTPLPLPIPLDDQNTFQSADLIENLRCIQQKISLRAINDIILSLPTDKRVAKSAHVFAGMVQAHKPVFDDLSVTLTDGGATVNATIHSNVLQALAPVKVAFGTIFVLQNVSCMMFIVPIYM